MTRHGHPLRFLMKQFQEGGAGWRSERVATDATVIALSAFTTSASPEDETPLYLHTRIPPITSNIARIIFIFIPLIVLVVSDLMMMEIEIVNYFSLCETNVVSTASKALVMSVRSFAGITSKIFLSSVSITL